MIRRLIPVMLAVTPAVSAQARGDFRWEKPCPPATKCRSQISGDISGAVHDRQSRSGRHQARQRPLLDRIKPTCSRRRAASRSASSTTILIRIATSAAPQQQSRLEQRPGSGLEQRQHESEIAVPANLIVSASNVSGDIQLTGMQGDVRRTTGGDIRLDRLRATSVHANSVSGDVVVRVEELIGRGDLSFHTVSGDVTLELPRQLDVDLSMSTVSGGIDSDYALTIGGNGRMNRRSMDARIGAGGRRLDLATVSGDVKLRMIR
jgi:hypothetical protein